MAKLKINNRFGIIPNKLLNNPNITFKVKGLFGYLQSKPDNWDFSADRIKNDTKESRDAILSGLKDLEKFGYLQRNRFKNNKGQRDVEYILFEETSTENPEWSSRENPTSENPTSDNATYNKEINNKKEIVKKKPIKALAKTKVFTPDSFEYLFSYKFLEAHKKNNTPGVLYKLKNIEEEEIIQSFAAGIDKLKRLDKINEKQIEFILNFIIGDNIKNKPNENFYWLDQIQTIDKLRKPNKEGIPYFVALIDPAKKEYILKNKKFQGVVEV